MKEESKNKCYVISAIIQLIALITFATTMYFMFESETIILNPVPYTVGIGAVMLIIDYIILTTILNKQEQVDFN